MDSLSGMSVFARVADRQSFTAAAEDLKISKSAVSKQIARLEDRLGVQLIHRTTRRLHLTEVGQAYFERAKRIVEDAEAAEQTISNLHGELHGTLRINAPQSYGVRRLSPLLPEFMDRHPNLNIDISFNDRRIDMIEEGFDVGIRITRMPDSSLMARKLGTTGSAVVASPDYWQKYGKPEHPNDLINHRCLLYDYSSTPREWPFLGPDGPFSVPIKGRFRSNNGDALLKATIGGIGINYIPTFLTDRLLESGKLESALDSYVMPSIDIHAVWPQNRHLSAKVRAFIDYLVEKL